MKVKQSFSLLLPFLIITFSCNLASAELQWSITYKIQTHANGTATWIIEHRTLLETKNDEIIFFQYASSIRFDQFKENVTSMVNEAWRRIGRNMTVPSDSFKMDAGIFYAAQGAYGIVKYYFDWVGFAQVIEDLIEIGDVFDGEFIDLDLDDTLLIEYPLGYTVAPESTTNPDMIKERERTLIWYGPKDFGLRQPAVTIRKTTSSIVDVLQQYLFAILGMIAFIGIGASLRFFRFRRKEAKVVHITKLAIETEKDDEEKIVTLLRASGGRLLQSDIIKQLGFSKSKVSKILKSLEIKGVIKRETKGRRRKIVTLTG